MSEVGQLDSRPIQKQNIRVYWDDSSGRYASVIVTNDHTGFRLHTDNVRVLADQLHDLADKHGL